MNFILTVRETAMNTNKIFRLIVCIISLKKILLANKMFVFEVQLRKNFYNCLQSLPFEQVIDISGSKETTFSDESLFDY